MSDVETLLAAATVVGATAGGEEVRALRVARGTAPEVWRRLRAAYGETGWWPFLVDADKDVAWRQPRVWDHLVEGGVCDGVRSAEEIFAGVSGEDSDGADRRGEDDDEDEDEAEYLAALESGEADLSGPPRDGGPAESETTNLGLMRASEGGWDVPRLLGWDGAVNHGISGTEHSNVLAYWHRRYGAELMVVTFDTLELLVPDPPTAREEVEAVARAQYNYCADIVDQGCETLAVLAETQVHSHHWFFWWD